MITLSKSGNSVTFTFENNGHYLQNGVIEVPVNGLILVTDESNMATFKKIDGDLFISATYDELGKTKAEMIAWYEENMVGSTGGGGGDITSGEVQTMIDESISGKAESSDVATVSGNVQTLSGQVETDEKVTATALVDLNERKADTSAVTASIGVVTAALQTKLDATAYTPVTVATQVQQGNSNPVSSNAVYDKTTITTTTTGEQESGNLLISDGGGGLDQSEIDEWIWGSDPSHGGDSWTNGKAIFTLQHISYLDVTVQDLEGQGFTLEYNNGTASCTGGTAVISGNTSGSRFRIIVSGFTGFLFDNFDGGAVAEGSYDDNLECGGDCGDVFMNIIYEGTVENTEWVNDVVSAKTPYWDAKLDASAYTPSVASSAITSGDTNAVAGGAVYDKFDEVEEVTARALNDLNDKFGGMKLQSISQADYDALVSGGTVQSDTLYIINNVVN